MVTHYKTAGHLACGHHGKNLVSTTEFARVKGRPPRSTQRRPPRRPQGQGGPYRPQLARRLGTTPERPARPTTPTKGIQRTAVRLKRGVIVDEHREQAASGHSLLQSIWLPAHFAYGLHTCGSAARPAPTVILAALRSRIQPPHLCGPPGLHLQVPSASTTSALPDKPATRTPA